MIRILCAMILLAAAIERHELDLAAYIVSIGK